MVSYLGFYPFFHNERKSPVQTFLPYPDFEESALALDPKRLGKQRVEAQQILDALEGRKKGWANHPAVLMWKGHEAALRLYRNTIIREWLARGYRNSMRITRSGGRVRMPPWLGDQAFHAAHRSNLLRKNPVFYQQHGWNEGPDLPYLWPGS